MCLESLSEVAAATLDENSDSEDTADLFWDICVEMPGVDEDTCSEIWEAIFMDDNNLGARAGMMCSLLEYCSVEDGCTDLEAFSLDDPDGTLTGSLDLCAAEGVEGGLNTTLPSVEWTSKSCRGPDDCQGGQVCYVNEDLMPQICSCVDGWDECYDVGTCTSYCALTSTVQKITNLNAGASSCDPDFGNDDCGDDEVCVSLDDCESWSCDADTQSLISTECFGKCRPSKLVALSAKIANNGQSIALKLNAYPRTLRSVACSRVFDSTTSALLGSSLCSTSADTLTVTLAPSATLTRAQQLTFAANSVLVSQIDPKAPFTGSISMESCASCVSPKAALTGPAAVQQPCAGGGLLSVAGALPPSFDASLSTDPSGRSTWANVVWSIDPSVGPVEGRAVLLPALTRTNAATSPNGRLVLTMLSSEVTALPEASYTLRVTVTSWLGTVSTATLTFAKTSGAKAPPVKVIGPSAQSFRISSGVRVGASAGQICGGRTVSWLWTSPTNWASMPKAGVASQQLFLAAPLAVAIHGQTYTVRISSSFVGEADSTAYDEVAMTAVGALPSASLKGPSGDVPDDTLLVLNATASFDPESTPALQKLSFSWDCRREDFPAPCFTGSQQGDSSSTPGVWRLDPKLLASGKVHTITVTVNKNVLKTATPLRATASLSFRPRNAAEPFPRGTLSRQCSPSECPLPHRSDKDLTVMLVLNPSYTDSTVTWSSTEIPSVSSLVAVSADNDANTPKGTFILTIPAASLPTGLASATITANLKHGSTVIYTGSAIVTVPLNTAPSCSLDTDPSACVTVDLASDTFPTAVATLRAQGWSDDTDTQLTYEFGIRSASGSDSPQALGVTTSAPIVGLWYGNVTLYVCAKDSSNARTCGTTVVTIKAPGPDFDAAGMLKSLDLSNLGTDQTAIMQASAQVSLLQAYIALTATASPPPASSGKGGSSAKASDADILLASSQAISLIKGVVGSTNFADLQQVQLALSSIQNVASSNAGLLNSTAQTELVDAAVKIANSVLSKNAVDSTFATQLLLLLSASAPEDASVGAAGALAWLRKVLAVAKALVSSLGKAAVPGATYTTAGSGSVWMGVSALPSLQTIATTVRAGSGAKALASSSSSGNTGRRRSALQQFQTSEHYLNPRMALAEAASLSGSRRRALLQTPGSTTALASVTAEAVLTLTGAAASGATDYAVGLTYVSSANVALLTALGSAKPATVDLRGGLAYVEWAAIGSSAASTPPTLDGSSSFIRIRIPAPGYDAGKLGTCVRWDSVSNAISGSLTELSAGASPATFESYDATTGRVVCKATVAGVYVVAQNQQSVYPSPPPPVASPPPPPPGTPSVPPGASLPPSPPPPPPPSPFPPLGDPQQGQQPPSTPAGSPGSPTVTAAKSSSIPIGAVVGGVVGGIAALAIIIAVFIIVRRRKWQVVVAAQEGSPAAGSQPLTAVTVSAEPAAAWQEGNARQQPAAQQQQHPRPDSPTAARASVAEGSAAAGAAAGVAAGVAAGAVVAAAVVAAEEAEQAERPASRQQQLVEGVDFNLPHTPREPSAGEAAAAGIASPRAPGSVTSGSPRATSQGCESLRAPAVVDDAPPPAPMSEPLTSPRTVDALRPVTSRPASAAGTSRPGSAAGAGAPRPASAAGASRPGSAAGGSRPGSAAGSRTASGTGQPRPFSASGAPATYGAPEAAHGGEAAVRTPAHMPLGEQGGDAPAPSDKRPPSS